MFTDQPRLGSDGPCSCEARSRESEAPEMPTEDLKTTDGVKWMRRSKSLQMEGGGPHSFPVGSTKGPSKRGGEAATMRHVCSAISGARQHIAKCKIGCATVHGKPATQLFPPLPGLRRGPFAFTRAAWRAKTPPCLPRFGLSGMLGETGTTMAASWLWARHDSQQYQASLHTKVSMPSCHCSPGMSDPCGSWLRAETSLLDRGNRAEPHSMLAEVAGIRNGLSQEGHGR